MKLNVAVSLLGLLLLCFSVFRWFHRSVKKILGSLWIYTSDYSRGTAGWLQVAGGQVRKYLQGWRGHEMQVRRWVGKARQLKSRWGKWEQVCGWVGQSGDVERGKSLRASGGQWQFPGNCKCGWRGGTGRQTVTGTIASSLDFIDYKTNTCQCVLFAIC